MDFSGGEAAANAFRELLAEMMDVLMVQAHPLVGTDLVKEALPRISRRYKTGLRYACTDVRTDWADPTNRCAYVFIYLVHHCYVVYCALRHSALRAIWPTGSRSLNIGTLRVCSVGGGPGSDLLGLTQFLDDNAFWPSGGLDCLVLDLYPEWRNTWDVANDCLSRARRFTVTYRKCNLVKDRGLSSAARDFVQRADLVTLIKSFSAVSAFFRQDRQSGSLLRALLADLRPGCFVLFVDNECGGDDQFQQDFALPAGLTLVEEYRGRVGVPFGRLPPKVRQYSRALDYNPMRQCELVVQLFQRPPSIDTVQFQTPTAGSVQPQTTYTDEFDDIYYPRLKPPTSHIVDHLRGTTEDSLSGTSESHGSDRPQPTFSQLSGNPWQDDRTSAKCSVQPQTTYTGEIDDIYSPLLETRTGHIVDPLWETTDDPWSGSLESQGSERTRLTFPKRSGNPWQPEDRSSTGCCPGKGCCTIL